MKNGKNGMKGLIIVLFFLLFLCPLFSYPPTDDDYLHSVGGRLYDELGNEVWLTGVNWFGFETGDHVVHGLWSRNWKDVLNEVSSLGFNLIRMPMSVSLVHSWMAGTPLTPLKIEYGLNADLAGLSSLEIFDKIHAYAEKVGLKIMLDMHSVHDLDHKEALWYNASHSVQDFVDSWKWIVNRVKDKDVVIAVDLFNEPHGTPFKEPGAIWDNSSAPQNWRRVAQETALEILAVNPNLLIMVEGIESYPKPGFTFASTREEDYYNNWWGGNLRGVAAYPVNLGTFQNKLVYSPHDYGPAIWEQNWFKIDFNKETLTADCWYPNWYYIQDSGIAPVLIGEWGGKVDGTDHPNNMRWMTALKDFIKENKIHYTFWALNDNSGDTGGIYVNDFQGIVTAKYELVKEVLWTDPQNGKFIGLDHQILLNSEDSTYLRNGTNVTLASGGTLMPTPPANTPTPVPVSDYYGKMQVEYKCGEVNQEPVSSQIKPHIRIKNTGDRNIALNSLKAYYYYTKQGFIPEAYYIDYAAKIASSNIIGTFATGYFELAFASSAGDIASGGDSGEIQIRIGKTDHSNYDQSDDYSFGPSVEYYEPYEKIVLLLNDELVWGVFPGGNPATPTPTPQGKKGDVNGSGVVDIVDALMIAQHYVGLNPPGFNSLFGDVNNTGTIDIIDALMVAQFYVGLISEL